MEILVADIETTGFDLKLCSIVEVGAAILETKTGKITPAFNRVCREKHMTAKDRNAWVFGNTSLTIEEVRGAPDFSEIRSELQNLIDSCDYVVAYNKKFDFDFLRSRDIIIFKELECPMILLTPVCKIVSKRGYKWPSVEEAWKYFFPNEPYIEKHRGLDDAIHEARIIQAMGTAGLYNKRRVKCL